MKKLIIVVIALLTMSSAFACDRFVRCGGGYGDGGAGYYGDYNRDRNIGRDIAQEGIGAAIAIAAIQVGSAVGTRIAQEISGTPAQQQVQTRVVYVVACDRTPFVRGGLVYADQCDGFGPVVVGRIDRR